MLENVPDVRLPRSPTPWSEIPIEVLRAELLKRAGEDYEKPECGSKGARASYNTSLHVFALILILALSTAACSFPIIVRRFPNLPIPVPHRFLFLSRHFGTGVLIATAFVHLLPTAFVSLTDPCLPSFWNKGYPAMAGLIAMVSVLVVVGIEMFFATRGAGHMHGSEYDTMPHEHGAEEQKHLSNGHARPSRPRTGSLRHFRQTDIGPDGDDAVPLRRISGSTENFVAKPQHAQSPTNTLHTDNHSDGASDLDLDELDPTSSSTNPATPSNLSTSQLQKKMLLQCLLLEAGILFHSVFIGMAVSVSVGPPFIVLLIAISFHQTFEGLALGSRIAAITSFPPSSPKPWLMALAYGTTTPIGQAIGLAVHGLYDPAGEVGLLMVGIMNAISSGLLLFAGLVELLAEDFLSDRSYEVLSGRRRLEACAAVVGGGLLMALVGAWA